MTIQELYAKADALEAEARELRRQAAARRDAEIGAKPLADRLVYAAEARCPCGAGLAYDPVHTDATHARPWFWDCSAILLRDARTDVQHTDRLPFAFYEVKSEGQNSACGRTTRPKPSTPATA